ncbi:hypothetical protein V8F33_007717 [Rhypophila sp. PSN 637]
MSSLPTYYAQQMLNLHTRFGLSENARSLLSAHDDWKLGRISQDELGRIIKTSANMRQAIIDTITKVNNIMKKKPEEQKMCLDIIQACADMLTALEKPAEIKGFPLMNLPVEIRRMVYGWYVNAKIAKLAGAVTHPRILPKTPGCYCPSFVASTPSHQFDLALARTGKKVRDEFLEYFYQSFRFHFTCGCELTRRFETTGNDIMRQNLRNVKIHWSGIKSNEAFLLLARCHKLKSLEVVVSKCTSFYLTARETEMRRYFVAQKAPRLPDALGMDELLLIRGIESLTVSHSPLKTGARRSEDERASLEGLLRAKLMLPRTEL